MEQALKIGFKEVGVQEIIGSKHNPAIIKYFQAVKQAWVKDDETAWCAAFVGYCLETAGIPSTKKLNARSYMEWGVPVKEAKLGDIAVFWRGTREGALGHIGFVINDSEGSVWILGGNQSNMVNVAKYPKSKLLGFRTYEAPKPIEMVEQPMVTVQPDNKKSVWKVILAILKVIIKK